MSSFGSSILAQCIYLYGNELKPSGKLWKWLIIRIILFRTYLMPPFDITCLTKSEGIFRSIRQENKNQSGAWYACEGH